MIKSPLLIISAILLTGCAPEINKPTEIFSIYTTGNENFRLIKTGVGNLYVKKEDVKNYQVGEFYNQA